MDLYELSFEEQNVLIASTLGDGEITKLYPGSRRKNNSYREHFSSQQLDYRIWKLNLLPSAFYFNQSKTYLLSPSLPLLTQMYPYFYNNEGKKIVSKEMLKLSTSPLFLATLFLDDGSLSITVQKNELKKLIFLTPHIYLYLQCLSLEDLITLKEHIFETFSVDLRTRKRKDGYGYVLKTTKVSETMKFLNAISSVTNDCPSMFYKTNWDLRFQSEIDKYKKSHPEYEVFASSSERRKNYTEAECNLIHEMKNDRKTDKAIALKLGRSYWSVVYKWRELRGE